MQDWLLHPANASSGALNRCGIEVLSQGNISFPLAASPLVARPVKRSLSTDDGVSQGPALGFDDDARHKDHGERGLANGD